MTRIAHSKHLWGAAFPERGTFMNRKTKGAIAVGAGAILLLGGMGSYALWSDAEDVAGADITAGAFGLACPNGAWTDVSGDVPVTAVTPGTTLMVPGDIWEYNVTCTVTATGKNMRAQLSVTDLGTDSTLPPTSRVDIETEVDNAAYTNAPIVVSGGQVLPVKVTVAFDPATTGTDFTNGQINVSGMQIMLNQVRPS
ncbi:alternate-type signal peptide domain-containing protein [Gordonia namibiensis]|nr:alternate-type signal peptide domain-containing protein [Gordonia namibiensis]